MNTVKYTYYIICKKWKIKNRIKPSNSYQHPHQMTYPRSRLFRRYEADMTAQQISEQKSYPRSRLFQAYEKSKQQMKSISVQELFQMAKEVEAVKEATKEAVQDSTMENKVRTDSQPTEWGEEDEEFDFTKSIDY